MRDWSSEVSRRLATSKLSDDERAEIARELAGYLDDLCVDARGNGNAAEASIIERAAAELHEDPYLGAHLARARKENTMNDRTKRFWLPGTAILLASAAALEVLQFAGFSPYFPRAWAGNASADPFLRYSLMLYFPWLCVLPFLGAIGAYWSRRTGSGPALRIAVGIFPAFVFLATFLVWVPASLAIGALPSARTFVPALAGFILSWVVIPGAALMLGVVPFLRDNNAGRRIA